MIDNEILQIVSQGICYGIASKLMYNLVVSGIYALLDIMKQ
nr:MAG TPA: hypothetical protein [Inoviridae sp.]